MKKKVLFFSNLYPLPWEPTRGQFNLQQTNHMEQEVDISYLIPVAFMVWLKHVLFKRQYYRQSNYCLFPFFYLPGIGRSLHPLLMLLSMIVSIKPILWFARHKYVLTSWAYPEGAMAAKLKKVFNFVLTIDCLGSDVNVHSQCPKRKKQLAYAFKQANTVTTKSKALAKLVLQIEPSANVKTIYNGVNFEKFTVTKKPTNGKINLLFIGNLIKTKGVFELLQAALTLKASDLDFELAIVGKGPEQKNINDYIQKNNLGDSVNFIGALAHEQLNNQLAKAHALILPSYREGVPNVIMEALATGTPVIATAVGGIPEVLQNKVNGILLADYQAETIVAGVHDFLAQNWSSETVLTSIAGFTWARTSEQFLETF